MSGPELLFRTSGNGAGDQVQRAPTKSRCGKEIAFMADSILVATLLRFFVLMLGFVQGLDRI